MKNIKELFCKHEFSEPVYLYSEVRKYREAEGLQPFNIAGIYSAYCTKCLYQKEVIGKHPLRRHSPLTVLNRHIIYNSEENILDTIKDIKNYIDNFIKFPSSSSLNHLTLASQKLENMEKYFEDKKLREELKKEIREEQENG